MRSSLTGEAGDEELPIVGGSLDRAGLDDSKTKNDRRWQEKAFTVLTVGPWQRGQRWK